MLKYDKTESEKRAARQKAFDYCMYMMLSSYFTSARCYSKQIESQLFLYYKDLRDREECEMETQCIKLIESQIVPNIPQRYFTRRAMIKFYRRNFYSATEIIVHTPNYYLLVKCPYNGRNTEIIMKQYFRQK